LLLVNWSEEFDGLHFHYHLVLDNQVGAESSLVGEIIVNAVDDFDVMRPGGGEEIYYLIADWLSLRRLRAQRTNGSRA